MLTSDKSASDNFSRNEIKPAMAVGHRVPGSDLQSPSVPAGLLPGATPRGPLKPDHRRLASKVDVRLSGKLRAALTAAAKADGVTDGAWIRNLVADRLGVAAADDRASGPRQRIPDEDLVVLSGLVRDAGALYAQVQARRPHDVLPLLDRIRTSLIPMVVGLNGRSS